MNHSVDSDTSDCEILSNCETDRNFGILREQIMHAILLSSLITSSAVAGATASTNVSALRNRNILFFMVDDGGFESPVWGNTHIQTPNIAKLASRGTRFTQAFTAVSSCSPSRSAVLTGLPTHQNGMYGLHQYPGNFQSHLDVRTLPRLLNDAGYKTGIIGKHHVGPIQVYNFTYGTSSKHCWAGGLGDVNIDGPQACRANYNYVARNVTAMAGFAREFLSSIEPDAPFFLYVGFGDTHRCGFESALGSFCEHYGSGGAIPDWTPPNYTAHDVLVPPFLPDNPAVRADLVGQYIAWTRLDAGVGLMLSEVEEAKASASTLILFFSDNGIPFPSGKTNLFEQGQHEPLLVFSPLQTTHGRASHAVVSSLDLMPTMLAWTAVTYPSDATAATMPAALGGASLLPLLDAQDTPEGWHNTAFGSHQFHVRLRLPSVLSSLHADSPRVAGGPPAVLLPSCAFCPCASMSVCAPFSHPGAVQTGPPALLFSPPRSRSMRTIRCARCGRRGTASSTTSRTTCALPSLRTSSARRRGSRSRPRARRATRRGGLTRTASTCSGRSGSSSTSSPTRSACTTSRAAPRTRMHSPCCRRSCAGGSRRPMTRG